MIDVDTDFAGGFPAEPLDDEVEGIEFLYSSGTTGRPKAIKSELPFAPIGTPPAILGLFQQLYGFGEDMVYLSPAPLYHSAPLRFNMVVQRLGGTSIVMERFDALELLELVERHRVTHIQMVPTMFVRLLRLTEEERARFDLSSLRAVVHAAAPCPVEIKAQMIEWLGPIVHEYYSSTEVHLFTAIDATEWLTHRGSVGRRAARHPAHRRRGRRGAARGRDRDGLVRGRAEVRVPQRPGEDRGLARRARAGRRSVTSATSTPTATCT